MAIPPTFTGLLRGAVSYMETELLLLFNLEYLGTTIRILRYRILVCFFKTRRDFLSLVEKQFLRL